MKTRLTIAILTHNSASHLKQLLPQLSFADTVMIIDDNSTDDTVTLAKQFGAKVISRNLNGNYGSQRNFALKMALKGYVLFLDPDERLTPQLIKEIKATLANPEADAYYIKRKDVYLGRKLNYGEAGQTKLIRLGKKGSGWWKRPVHEVWKVKKTADLHAELIHYAHNGYDDFKAAVDRYAALEASFRHNSLMPWSLWETVAYPIGKFLMNYVLKLGFLDGRAGLIYALMMSRHSFEVRANLFKLDYHLKKDGLWEKLWRGLFYLWLFTLGLYQLLRWQINPTTAVYGFEGLMFGLILMGGGLVYRKRDWEWPNWGVGLGVFGLGLGVSLAANFWLLPLNEWVRASLHYGRVLFYGLFALVIWNVFRLQIVKLSPWRWLVYLGFGIGFLGFLQYFIWPDLRWLYAFGWDDHLYRLVSTLLDPGFTGLILALTLVILISTPLPHRKLFWVIVFMAMMLTYSRSSYLSYLFGDWWVSVKDRNIKGGLLRTILVLVVLVILPRPAGEGVRLERTYSIEARAKSTLTAWELFKKEPIFGIGFNAYRFYTQPKEETLAKPVHPSAPDNSYVYILVTSGVVGMATFVVLVWTLIKIGIKSTVLSGSLIVMGISALTNNSLFYPLTMIWLSMLLSAEVMLEPSLSRGNKSRLSP